MIYIGENKAAVYKGDFHPAELYKGDKKIAGYTVTEFSGEGSVVLENCYNDKVYNACADEGVQSITVRGKNRLKVISGYGQTLYNNGFTFTRPSDRNSGAIMPINIKKGTKFTVSFDLIDFSASVDTRVRFRFRNSDGNIVEGQGKTASSTVSKYNQTITALDDLVSVQFYFINTEPAGSYFTIDNVMLRTEGDGTFEPYVTPQTIVVGNGELTEDIPTFHGTTIIEIAADTAASISGKYKKQEG